MAESTVTAVESGRNISVSRLVSRQGEEKVEREANVISRQKASQEIRTEVAVETQTGRNVNTVA